MRFWRNYHWFAPVICAVPLGTAAVAGVIKSPISKPFLNKLIVHAEEGNLSPVQVQYLIVGSGPTAYSALRTIRYLEPASKVLLVTQSKYMPYEKLPLNFEAWLSDDFLESYDYLSRFSETSKNIFYQPEEFYLAPFLLEEADEYGGQALLIKHKVERLDPEKRIAYLSNGDSIQYKKCLLTLGSHSVLPSNLNHRVSQYFSLLDNLDDFHEVYDQMKFVKSLAVMGNSLKAIEFAASQAILGAELPEKRHVTLICEGKLLESILPECVRSWVLKELKETGVKVIESTTSFGDLGANEIKNGVSYSVSITDKENKNLGSFDKVVCMLPRKPNLKLPKNSGLESNDSGVVANSCLQVRSNLYAAGSAVSFFHPIMKKRMSLDLPDHSILSGRFAAINMLGDPVPYFKLPRTMGDFGYDFGLDSIGEVDSSLETMVYFVYEDKLKGIDSENEASEAKKAPVPEEASEDASTNAGESGLKSRSVESSKDQKEIESPSMETQFEVAKENSESSESPVESRDLIGPPDKPITSCAVIYLRDGVTVGVATMGAFGRMYIAENMISRKVAKDELELFIPLLLSTNFKLKKPEDEEQFNI